MILHDIQFSINHRILSEGLRMITNNALRLQLGIVLLAGVSIFSVAADEPPPPAEVLSPEPVSAPPVVNAEPSVAPSTAPAETPATAPTAATPAEPPPATATEAPAAASTPEVTASPATPPPAETPAPAAAAPVDAPTAPETAAPATVPEPAAAPVADSKSPKIRDGVGERYVVKKGDTLWGIAQHFLKDPWLWPEVWQVNPKIRNPHLIYPGDVIVLQYDAQGKPMLVLEGTEAPKTRPAAPGKSKLPVVKIEPQIRYEKLRKAVSTLPKGAIAAFLNRPYLLSPDALDDAPYIVSSQDEHLSNGAGARLYVNNLENTTINAFVVVRAGQKFEDPETGEVLGLEGINIGDASLVKVGSPSTLIFKKSRQEANAGDYLVPVEKNNMDLNFFPRAPKQKIRGQIISVYQGVSRIGQYNVVAINRGEEQGLEPGHVLEVYQSGTTVRDPQGGIFNSTVTLPEERAGVVMIFSVYRKVSFGLIMKAEREMRVLDAVVNP